MTTADQQRARTRAAHARAAAARESDAATADEIRRAIHSSAPRVSEALVVRSTPAGAADGTNLLTVSTAGGEVEAAWVGDFPPPVGALVLLLTYADTVYILGRLNGLPPE